MNTQGSSNVFILQRREWSSGRLSYFPQWHSWWALDWGLEHGSSDTQFRHCSANYACYLLSKRSLCQLHVNIVSKPRSHFYRWSPEHNYRAQVLPFPSPLSCSVSRSQLCNGVDLYIICYLNLVQKILNESVLWWRETYNSRCEVRTNCFGSVCLRSVVRTVAILISVQHY